MERLLEEFLPRAPRAGYPRVSRESTGGRPDTSREGWGKNTSGARGGVRSKGPLMGGPDVA